MIQKLCAEYLRISPADASELRDLSAPAATHEGGTAGLVSDGAEKHILEHFVNTPDEKALDVDTDWESLLITLTGNPIDGQALGDPLAESILGADRVCRKPLAAVIDNARLDDVLTTLAGIDVDARIEANGSQIPSERARERVAELVEFYTAAKESGDAVLVAIS